uniref:DUF488 domain-containing protein n=1 Tax=Thermorudis sp. TaxID=1969470 RepID=A0A7C2WJW0_9BACT
MRIFTIGFTKKSAQEFFELLRASGAERVVDVRLNNVSQLAGFTKRDDLAYFLRQICDMDYVHVPQLAPTPAILDAYRKKQITWNQYEVRFLELMEQRRIEETVPKQIIEEGCLLCSEDKPDHCHRRLVAEYLARHWGDVEILHL